MNCFTYLWLQLTTPLQSSKVSRSPIKRLTRKDRSRRGQESASDHNHQKDKLHVSFSDVTPPSGTHSSTCQSKPTGPNLKLRRRTLLLEDGLDSAPRSHRDSICSWPDLNTDAPVSGSRSVLLHQTADKEPPPPSPSSPRGQSDLTFVFCSALWCQQFVPLPVET